MYHAREVNYINSKVLNSFSYVVQSLNWKYKHVETKSVEARVKRPVIFFASLKYCIEESCILLIILPIKLKFVYCFSKD